MGDFARSKDGKDAYGLDVREKTLADLLREQGYVTGALGKWHLGDQPQYFPTKRGFDYFYGYLQWGHYYLNPTAAGACPSDRSLDLVVHVRGRPGDGPLHESTSPTARSIATSRSPVSRAT